MATLAYLAIQILHNTVAQNAQSQRVISEGFRTVNLLLARDRELLNVMSRGNKDFAALDEEEAMAFSNYTASFLRTYEDAYSDHRRGVLEDSYWEARIGNLGAYISQQGFQQWWDTPRVGTYVRNTAEMFRPEFVMLIVKLMNRDEHVNGTHRCP